MSAIFNEIKSYKYKKIKMTLDDYAPDYFIDTDDFFDDDIDDDDIIDDEE